METANSRLRPVAKEIGLTSERFEYRDLSENAEYYIRKTKKKDRSYLKLEDWKKEGYAKTDICERLLKECPDDIERVDFEDLSASEFIEKYESKNKPVIIRGLTKGWKTDKYWTFEQIYQRYKDEMLKAGENLLKKMFPKDQYRFGYHEPPMNSVHHLHLHCLVLPITKPFFDNYIYGSCLASTDMIIEKTKERGDREEKKTPKL